MGFTIGDVVERVKGKLISGDLSSEIGGFSIDSRSTKQGDLFIAVKGHNFDGHDFVGEAVRNGATGVIGSDLEKSKSIAVKNIVQVDCTIDALKCISALIRDNASIPFICVTGTNGKTTVKEMLRQMLSVKYKTLCSKRSFNNIFGVALTLFELKAEHEVAILEIGTNSRGEISELAKILKPDIGIINNIGYGHIEAFKDLEGVLLEKMTLLDHLKENGIAVINKDDALLAGCVFADRVIRYFGTKKGSDFLISDISRDDSGYSFLINGRELFIPVYGEHNVYNAAAAVCAADFMNVSITQIRKVLKHILLPDMRLTKVMVGDILFINDAYNANPGSFLSALNVVRHEVVSPQKGVIAGDMLELGGSSDELHSLIGKRIAELDMDFFIGLGPQAEIMVDAAVESGMSAKKTKKVKSHEDAASALRMMAVGESVVLLKGSRKSKMEEVVKCFMNYSMD